MAPKASHAKAAIEAKPLKRAFKKPKLGVKSVSKRKATPPPKPKVVPQESTSHVAKGKGKARDTTPAPTVMKGKAKATNGSSNKPKTVLPTSFKIIAGSYEKLLYGLEGTVTAEGTDLQYNLKPIFIFPAHISSIKAVAASPGGGKWLATGSSDEIVKVWDLRRRKEIGGLMHHEGSITHLEFPSRSHLLSASEDGTLCLFRARDWSVLRSLKGHKGRVNSVAVHPSGKVALSVGKDRTLRMWDLMRGKGSASTKLGKEGELVRWSVDGSRFAVQAHSTIDIYDTDMKLLHTINHPSRLHDVKFSKHVDGTGDILLAGAEDKKLTIYNLPSDANEPPSILAEMVGHSNRVKAVDTIKIALPATSTSSRTSTTLVCTISSDGNIHIYDLASIPTRASPNDERVRLEPIAKYDTKGTRLTCLALADGDSAEAVAMNGKRKRKDEDEEEDSESENEDGAGEEHEEWG